MATHSHSHSHDHDHDHDHSHGHDHDHDHDHDHAHEECSYIQAGVLQKAPVFSAQAYHNGDIKTFNLAEQKGKWVVLFFYPLDFTFVCPTELKAFASQYETFKKEGAEVVACSIDSVYSHKAWFSKDLPEVKYPIVSDMTKEIARSYGVLNEEKGFALRGTFIIDPQGVIQYQVVTPPPLGRSTEETLRSLQALKTGELCQANWKAGDKPLKP
jgi:peroxiredoxin (alkyl hydroperoxide reductase subunit C)